MREEPWESPYEMKSEEQLKEKADSFGCDLLVADDRTLLVDLDTPDSVGRFMYMIEAVADTCRSRVTFQSHEVVKSRGDGWHGIVRLAEPLPLPERVALQAILGGDPLREFLTLTEFLLCGHSVVCLFRPRVAAPLGLEAVGLAKGGTDG